MKLLSRLIKLLFTLLMVGALVAGLAVAGVYFYLIPELPPIDNLRDVQLQVPLRVYDSDHRLIAEFGEKRRSPLEYEEIPRTMVDAILAAEDDAFFSHSGIDYMGLARAAWQLLLTGERRQGGSTITMQVARNFYLTREKTYKRKLNEILLARRIEENLSKEEILALYLNKIYLGHRSYGIGAAAWTYYGKPINDLSLAQFAMIAGLPKAPSSNNPVSNPARALQRRNYILDRMLTLGLIDATQHAVAVATPVTATLHAPQVELEAPYIAELVRAEMVERYGQDAYTRGYEVETLVNGQWQQTAVAALRRAMRDYDQRHGYRGPEGQIDIGAGPQAAVAQLRRQPIVGDLLPAVITEVEEKQAGVLLADGATIVLEWPGLAWARPYIDEDTRGPAAKQAADVLRPGDLIRVRQEPGSDEAPASWQLSQVPKVGGALVALDPDNGAIRALVGGYDFYHTKFNRAVQARRQPGSGFKAFIYSAALEAGYTAASTINDAPVVFDDSSLEGAWRPENYSGKFFGPTRLRYALTKSRNLVSIRLLRAMGVQHALRHIEKFGFDVADLPANLSLALGSGAVTPLQMARAYAVLANGGFLIEPQLIRRIDLAGETVFEWKPAEACERCERTAELAATSPVSGADSAATAMPESMPEKLAPRVISRENRYIMYSMMRDVIQDGTGRKARVLGRKDIAGKTGTTNDQRDAWFNGYNQDLVAVTWIGFDDNSKLGRGEVGGRAALPAWIDFMRVALDGTPDRLPELPSGMITARIDAKTGLRARPGQADTLFEVFRPEYVPPLLATDPSDPIVRSEPGNDSSPGVSGGGAPAKPLEEIF